MKFIPALTAMLFLVTPLSAAAMETADLKTGVKREMDAAQFSPDGAGPFPAVIVLHGSGGVDRADILYARRLADEGYVALVPNYMGAYRITTLTHVDVFRVHAAAIDADLEVAAEMLRASPKVAGGKIGAVGFSYGGYFAAWLAAVGKVDTAVSYYGALTADGSDKDMARLKAAFSDASAPLLILHGATDRVTPVDIARQFDTLLQAAGARHELHVYDGVGSRFERDPSSSLEQEASRESWMRMLAFLGRALR